MARRPWRLSSAAACGFVFGLAAVGLSVLRQNVGLTGGDLAQVVILWPLIAIIIASARNALLHR